LKILVIIPAYNEEKSIVNVVGSLQSACPEADYVIVNDCSTDGTEKLCRDHNLNYVSLPINLGIGGGVQTGYKYAVMNNYDITVQLDGDGQHDPAYIRGLIKPILDGQADMVIGSRFIEKNGFQSSAVRRAGIHFLNWLIYLCCGVKISDTTSGFRACNKDLTKFFSNVYAEDYPEPEAIIGAVLNGYKVKEVPVTMNERKNGKSSISQLKSIYYMVKVSLAILVYRISYFKK
jgi:glycosyltransferase involved in cell wall biosynthesis